MNNYDLLNKALHSVADTSQPAPDVEPDTNDDEQIRLSYFNSDLENYGKYVLIFVSCVLLIFGLVFMFSEPAEIYGGDAYNGIIANIRGAAFIVLSGLLFVSAFLIKPKKR